MMVKYKKYIDATINDKVTSLQKFLKNYIDTELIDIENLKRKDLIELLKSYNKRKVQLNNYKEQLYQIKNYGLTGTKNENLGVQKSRTNIDLLEKTENTIEDIENIIKNYEYVLNKVERGLSLIKHDKYYQIIELRYLEGLPVSDILLKIDISHRTYSRHHTRLINELKSILIL